MITRRSCNTLGRISCKCIVGITRTAVYFTLISRVLWYVYSSLRSTPCWLIRSGHKNHTTHNWKWYVPRPLKRQQLIMIVWIVRDSIFRGYLQSAALVWPAAPSFRDPDTRLFSFGYIMLIRNAFPGSPLYCSSPSASLFQLVFIQICLPYPACANRYVHFIPRLSLPHDITIPHARTPRNALNAGLIKYYSYSTRSYSNCTSPLVPPLSVSILSWRCYYIL
jgi:hypothetical protein